MACVLPYPSRSSQLRVIHEHEARGNGLDDDSGQARSEFLQHDELVLDNVREVGEERDGYGLCTRAFSTLMFSLGVLDKL